jgi:hypothetical protein
LNAENSQPRLRILLWHIHGSYLFNLVQCPHDFFVPVRSGKPEGYYGRTPSYAWTDNLQEVETDDIHNLDFDCIIFQTRQNYLHDQYEILTEDQRRLPRIYIEHDPPLENPTDTRHIVDDPEILLVHVTHYNNLMWDSGRTPTRVIDHGVLVPDGARYTGEIEKGLVVINNIRSRGRRLGYDLFERARKQLPLDLAGIDSEELGGLGSLTHRQLLELEGRYRFIFNPIRYTSLGLAVCEAMMIGCPIVGLATTEMVTAVENGVSGYLDTNFDKVLEQMHILLAHPDEARRLGQGARDRALRRFNIQRFVSDWNDALLSVTASQKGYPRQQVHEIGAG